MVVRREGRRDFEASVMVGLKRHHKMGIMEGASQAVGRDKEEDEV